MMNTFDPITNYNLTNNTLVVLFQYSDYVTGGWFSPLLLYSSMVLVYMVLVLSSYKDYSLVASSTIGVFLAFTLTSAGVLHPFHLLITFVWLMITLYLSNKGKDL